MAVNKVIYGNREIINISDTTAVASDVMSGKSFYLKNGNKAIGNAVLPFGFLVVNYPSGATCTATNTSGSKDISPTKKLFYVIGVGDCEVEISATGKETKTQSVAFDVEGQSKEITMAFELIIYDGGSDISMFSGGVTTDVEGVICWNFYNKTYYTVNSFDVGGYTSLEVTFRAKSSENTVKERFGTYADGDWTSYEEFVMTKVFQTVTVPLPDSGNHKLAFKDSHTVTQFSLCISKVRLI